MRNRLVEAGFMTMREFCDYVQVHEMTLYRLCRQGKVRHVKVGSRYRFKKEWVDEMMQDSVKGLVIGG